MRADARRNRERLIDAARDAFTENGEKASLDDIVKRAGVGPGTLYRHFANREDLLGAVYQEGVEGLAAQAEEFAATLPPMEALIAFLRVQVDYAKSKRGLGVAVKATLDSEGEVLTFCRDTLRGGLGKLLRAAQETGEVREDVDPAVLLRLTHSVAVGSENAPELAEPMLRVVVDGLRAR
ncbi:TetR/AcrR family transcriptional regulator [Hamadaea sp. NPDC051192]|uniref:TetR/AcrR family transcriptional regulator n=1 Tax=Hamadaea sp. NPDC051192 TaxID=3154940 RepID=UPI0034290BAC